MCQSGGVGNQIEEASVAEVHIIGLDLAKRVFQAHGASSDGTVQFRKKLSRNKVLAFLASQPRCIVAMEACASAHHWGREIGALGHEVRLIAPAYVKPFVKRQKNDMADAEAILAKRRRGQICVLFRSRAPRNKLRPLPSRRATYWCGSGHR
jgi:transposase